MKSSVAKDRFYIECFCTSPDHLLVFDFWHFGSKHNYTEMSAQFVSPYYNSFWHRLKCSLKYLFSKEKYLWTSDSIIFDRKNLQQLKDVVDRMENILDEQDKETKEFKEKIKNKNKLNKA